MGSEYRPTSKPGSRLPHIWLEVDGRRVSTHDLIPLGEFLLLAGEDGGGWVDAARSLDVPVRCVQLGVDASDPTGGWPALREHGPAGVLLVRPDGHVAFRSLSGMPNPSQVLATAVANVLLPPG